MSGYGINPPGFGLDPYGDPFINIVGILSTRIYSMQFSLPALIEMEVSGLSMAQMEGETMALTLADEMASRPIYEECLLTVGMISDENILSVVEVN
jgi:hypothetical protein